MIDFVYGRDDVVAHAVARMIPHVGERGFGACKAIGVIDSDMNMIAGIVYHDWNPESGVIMVSAAALPGTRWLSRETVRRVYEFPFEQLGAQMVMHVVPETDERLLRQLAVLGCSLVQVPRMFGRERNGVLCLFMREEWETCRFIRRAPSDLKEAA